MDFVGFLIESRITETQHTDAFADGHVQIMTIHQPKGLEFPVVIVGSLQRYYYGTSPIDSNLGKFYHESGFGKAHEKQYLDWILHGP